MNFHIHASDIFYRMMHTFLSRDILYCLSLCRIASHHIQYFILSPFRSVPLTKYAAFILLFFIPVNIDFSTAQNRAEMLARSYQETFEV